MKSCVSILNGLVKKGIKYDLENIRALLEINSVAKYDFIPVLVAGTNGKGSVATFLSLLLGASGFRTGLYTSPHALTPLERIKINGGDIPYSDFKKLLFRIDAAVSVRNRAGSLLFPTYYEVLTALAALYFKEKKAAYAVFEIGMGGRLDSTNIFRQPLAVITGVSLDHTDILGKTLKKIAREKAGIIKADSVTISGETKKVAASVIKEAADKKNARLLQFGLDFDYRQAKNGIIIDTGKNKYTACQAGMAGLAGLPEYQKKNFTLAVMAAETLLGARLSDAALSLALKRFFIPLRMQVVSDSPVIIMDGAHNPEAVRALASEIKRFGIKKIKIKIFFTAMKDKDVNKMLSALGAVTENICIFGTSLARGLDGAYLKKSGISYPFYENFGKLFSGEFKSLSPDELVIICGSIYGGGEALKYFLRHRGKYRSLFSPFFSSYLEKMAKSAGGELL